MRRRSTIIGLLVGIVAGWTAIAAAQWIVESVDGEAGARLASLSDLRVEPVKTDDTYWPGDSLPLVVTVTNPNPRALGVRGIDIEDPQSGDESCDRSLENARTRFNRADLTLEPGEQRVQIGRLTLPATLAQGCVGKSLKIAVTLTAQFGS